MSEVEYSPDELEAIRIYKAATLVERGKLLKTAKFKKLTQKVRAEWEAAPNVHDLVDAFIDAMPDERKNTIAATSFLADGLARILARPEIQQSPEVTKALQAVHESIAALTILDITAEDIWEAFAFPHVSANAKKAAGKLRTKEAELNGAMELFQRWKDSPDAYRNLSEFARDCIRSEYASTEATAKDWAKRWGSDLPEVHPLKAKLGKLHK